MAPFCSYRAKRNNVHYHRLSLANRERLNEWISDVKLKKNFFFFFIIGIFILLSRESDEALYELA